MTQKSKSCDVQQIVRSVANGQPHSAMRNEEQFVLSEGLDFTPGQEQELDFSVNLPADSITRASTTHATHGKMPAMVRRDYDWWCVVLVDVPGGVTLSARQRIPLAV